MDRNQGREKRTRKKYRSVQFFFFFFLQPNNLRRWYKSWREVKRKRKIKDENDKRRNVNHDKLKRSFVEGN